MNLPAVRVLAIAQSLKGSMEVGTVARSLDSGIRAAGAEPVVLMASDGGDGLLDALGASVRRRTRHRVAGPLSRLVEAEAGWLDQATAVVESRLVCGLAMIPLSERDPMQSTTRGLGEMILQLEEMGARQIFVGLGGSATMDGGMGMARAWGWVPCGARGDELAEGGGSLEGLHSLRKGRRPAAHITGLVDVRNPLNGPEGARVFAAQKGASDAVTERLARGLERLTVASEGEGGNAAAQLPGAGAAGGLGFGLMVFGGGSLTPGAPWMLERAGFHSALVGAALVICIEGAFDATSLEGKLTGTVLAAAREAGVPAGLLAPQATGVPEHVLVESGGGVWTATDVSRHAENLVRGGLRSARHA
jgi:glycerate 2-kinase